MEKAITNVETDTSSKFPSDHYPLKAEVNLKLYSVRIRVLLTASHKSTAKMTTPTAVAARGSPEAADR